MSINDVKEGFVFLAVTLLFLWCISAGHVLVHQ